jgi:hypothetical protein
MKKPVSMYKAVIIFLLAIFSPALAHAKCEKGFAAQEREKIRANYARQYEQVEYIKNRDINDALEQYKAEYYPEAKSLLEEYNQERAALTQRIQADENGKGKQSEYNAQAREIGQDYRQEMSVLKKDKSGKYWTEISEIREDARMYRAELNQMKEEDLADLRAHIADDGCKDRRTPLRKLFEWTGQQVNKGKKSSPPPTGQAGPGIRG